MTHIIQSSLLVSGSITVTGGITGSVTGSVTGVLYGNATTATTAQTASYYIETDPTFTAKSASLATTGSNTFNGNQTIAGNLDVVGTASIAYLNVVIESSSVIYSSGSNQFGDAVDDQQTIIGITTISGSLSITGSASIPNLTGSLQGNAATATTSSYAATASYWSGSIQNATSASFAESASWAPYQTSASYAESALSASWAPSSITGSANYIPKFTSATTLGNSVIYESGSNVGIGTTSPLAKLDVNGVGIFRNVSDLATLSIGGTTSVNSIKPYTTNVPIRFLNTSNGYANIGAGSISVGANYGGTLAPTNGAIIQGNVGIGTDSPTAKLHISASGALSTDIALRVRNNANTADIITVAGNGNVNLENLTLQRSTNLQIQIAWQLNQVAGNSIVVSRSNYGIGDTIRYSSAGTWNPFGVGTSNFAGFSFTDTIAQTGSSTGTSRALYVNPTLTSATDWRSIEWTNNTGFGLYGSGDAVNYLKSGLGIGTSSPNAKLDVNGNAIMTGSLTVVGVMNQGSPFNTASGQYSHAEGYQTTASGQYSHAEGQNTKSTGTTSHAEGDRTQAKGYGSHAEGVLTVASASYSHAEGASTISSGIYSHAEGRAATSLGEYSHAEGQYTIASGSYAHAEGTTTIAKADFSHAEGYETTASGSHSHAEGRLVVASGVGSHAEGYFTQAKGDYSHAEGHYAIASGSRSHAEGNFTQAIGSYSHAEGSGTQAIGDFSHAEGQGTIASGSYQHVQGQYNQVSPMQSAFIVGNGTNGSSRSNLIYASGSQVHLLGNIGVGITSPTAQLHISASGALSTDTPFRISNNANTADWFKIDGTGAITLNNSIPVNSPILSFGRLLSGSGYFYADVSSYLTWNSTFQVQGTLVLNQGINITGYGRNINTNNGIINNASKITLQNESSIVMRPNLSSSVAENSMGLFIAPSQTGSLYPTKKLIKIMDGSLTNTYFTVNGLGQTGIGTATPTALVHVVASSSLSTESAFKIQNSGSTTTLFNIGGTGNTTITGSLSVSGGITGSLQGTASYAQDHAPVPTRYICNGYLTTNQTFATGSDVVIQFEDYDDPNGWLDGYKFTPTIAGYYHIDFGVWLNNPGSTTNQVNIQMRKNGATHVIIQQPLNNSVGQSLAASKIIYLNGSTDQLEFTIFQSVGSSATGTILQGTPDGSGTWFSAFLITQ
jgi:hypothetical protein